MPLGSNKTRNGFYSTYPSQSFNPGPLKSYCGTGGGVGDGTEAGVDLGCEARMFSGFTQ